MVYHIFELEHYQDPARRTHANTHTDAPYAQAHTHTHARTVCRCVYAPWWRVRAVTAFRKIRTTAYTYFPVAHRATPRNTQHSLPRILDQVGHTTPGSSERGGLTLLAREFCSRSRVFPRALTHFSGAGALFSTASSSTAAAFYSLRFSLPQIFHQAPRKSSH